MKFHLLHVRIARSYGFPRYVILASFHSIRTDFVSLVIFISQRNLVSFRQFYTKSKDRSTAAVTRAQNTLQRVILFRNLHRRNYFSRAIRREKNKKKKIKNWSSTERAIDRIFNAAYTFRILPSKVLETSKQRLVCSYVLANVAQTFDIGRFERVDSWKLGRLPWRTSPRFDCQVPLIPVPRTPRTSSSHRVET